MIQAYFLSVDELKAGSIINENVDDKAIVPVITKVQELRILEILGTAMYNELTTRLLADRDLSQPSNSDWLILLRDYIKPVMINYCVADATPEMAFKYMNNGVSAKSTSEAKAISFDDMLAMINRYWQDAEIYENRLINYLVAKAPTLFPLYYATGTDISYIYPKRNAFKSPIYLGRNDNKSGGMQVMVGGPLFPDSCP